MSTYSFEDLIDTMPDQYDMQGNSYESWCDYGILGFDESINSYFLQLDVNDTLIWWFGNTEREIESPYQLLAIIARLFNIDSSVEFNKEMVNILIKDREDVTNNIYEDHITESVLGHYRVQDDYWGKHCGTFEICADEDTSIFPTPASLRTTYIERAYKPYGNKQE